MADSDENDPSCGDNLYGDTEFALAVESTAKAAERNARNTVWRRAQASVTEVRKYKCPDQCPQKVRLRDTMDDKPRTPKILVSRQTEFGWLCVAAKSWEVSFDCVKPGSQRRGRSVPRPE